MGTPEENILVIGKGGREHAFLQALKDSGAGVVVIDKLSNQGMRDDADLVLEVGGVELGDFKALGSWLKEGQHEEHVTAALPGSESFFANGIVEAWKEVGVDIPIIGPAQDQAQFESSKDYAKKKMVEWGVQTADYQEHNLKTGLSAAKEAIDTWFERRGKIVLKADGLCGGKGVTICYSAKEAKSALDEYANSGDAYQQVLFEKFIEGPEYSVIVAADGNGGYQTFPVSMDHKQRDDGDRGPMTGGMGAVSPLSADDAKLLENAQEKVIGPFLEGLEKEGIDFKGFLYFGLKQDPHNGATCLEINVRFGDPETQVVLSNVSNFTEIVKAMVHGTLADTPIETVSGQHSFTIALISENYPSGEYGKDAGKEITGLEEAAKVQGVKLHYGSVNKASTTGGGRELYVTAVGVSENEAVRRAYQAANLIKFPGKHVRTDMPRKERATA